MWFFVISPKYQIKPLFSHNRVCLNHQTYKKIVGLRFLLLCWQMELFRFDCMIFNTKIFNLSKSNFHNVIEIFRYISKISDKVTVLSQSCLPHPSNLQKNSWVKTFDFMLANGDIFVWLHEIWRQNVSTCPKVIFIMLSWFFVISPKYQIKSLFSHNHVCPNRQTTVVGIILGRVILGNTV